MEDIGNMSDMDEEEFVTKKPVAGAPNLERNLDKESNHNINPGSNYNPRDPAGSQTSSFVAAFSKLKRSEFYKDPALEPPSTSSAALAVPALTTGVPVQPGVQRVGRTGALLVSPRQRGNPLLKAINSVPWEFEEMIPDYVMGAMTCALFLSLRYHNLNPDYIHDRLKQLGKKFRLRVLLVQVDLADSSHLIKHLNRLCILADLTLMLAGSADEAGRILETYKMFESKPPELIMEKKEEGLHTKLQNALTTVRSVNKTDAATLVKTFGSLENVLKATVNELELCPGFGTQKAQRLYNVLHQPFLRRS